MKTYSDIRKILLSHLPPPTPSPPFILPSLPQCSSLHFLYQVPIIASLPPAFIIPLISFPLPSLPFLLPFFFFFPPSLVFLLPHIVLQCPSLHSKSQAPLRPRECAKRLLLSLLVPLASKEGKEEEEEGGWRRGEGEIARKQGKVC